MFPKKKPGQCLQTNQAAKWILKVATATVKTLLIVSSVCLVNWLIMWWATVVVINAFWWHQGLVLLDYKFGLWYLITQTGTLPGDMATLLYPWFSFISFCTLYHMHKNHNVIHTHPTILILVYFRYLKQGIVWFSGTSVLIKKWVWHFEKYRQIVA